MMIGTSGSEESPFVTTAMIMAAGMGTRLRPFTNLRAKALLPVLGIPTVQFLVDSLRVSGVERLVVNVHHHSESTKTELRRLDLGEMSLQVSDESGLLLGSAGGIRQALPLLGDRPFFLANADVISEVDWRALAARHQKLRARYGVSLTLALLPEGPRGGSYREIVFEGSSGQVTGLGQSRPGKPFFMGAAVIEPEALEEVPSTGPAEFVPTILEPAIRKKKAGVFLTRSEWYDMGSPALWLETHFALMHQMEMRGTVNAPAFLWRERILGSNLRIADGIWISKGSRHPRYVPDWTGPCYWNGEYGCGTAVSQVPQVLGPQAVLYGQPSDSVPSIGAWSSGIGFGGLWVPI